MPRDVRDHITLSLITAEIEDQFLITSSLVKVLPEALAVRWSVASNLVGSSSLIRGSLPWTHIDGSRILEPSKDSRCFLRVVSGVYPIFTWSNCVRCSGGSSKRFAEDGGLQ